MRYLSMNDLFILSFFLCLSTLGIGQQENQNTTITGRYFGQKVPGTTPEVFARGLISTPESKYCTISFSGKMDEFYVYRSEGNKTVLLYSKMINGVWSPLEVAGFASGFKAMEPHITFDGERIFFNWEKPAPAGNPDSPFNIWYTVKTSSGWMDPKYAGTGMFVSSDREGNIYTTDMTSVMSTGKTYLAKVRIENGKFVSFDRLTIPEYIGSQAHPCISPDGRYILFDVDSGHHLFVSFRKSDGTWGNSIDLTNHGFDIMAGGASVTPDGKYLFFNLKGQLMWVSATIIENLSPYIIK